MITRILLNYALVAAFDGMIRIAIIAALLAASQSHAEILSTSASVRSDNALIVDIQVATGGSAVKLAVTYQAAGVDPLVSRWTTVSTSGPGGVSGFANRFMAFLLARGL
jgi:hypothetical protein